MSSSRHQGRRAVVTGAASGQGRATAHRLAGEGAAVLGIDLNRSGLEETFDGLPGCDWAATEVGSDECLAGIEAFGGVDILVNAAGILRRHDFETHPIDDWRRTLEVNVRAPFRLSRQFAANHLAAGEPGVIVNICSVESFVAAPRHVAYNASKSALLMLTRALAYELGPHGIRVVGVAPGVIETAMNSDLRTDPVKVERALRPIRMGRFGQPEEVAALISFLASDDASYITGSVVIVDGGWHLD
jgi:meso-butanediol dehydrogenase / (S,S)-butanediol dehydrogenase / diacetyl reductase